MADVDGAALRRLAAEFEPVLYFAQGERFFPCQAETWLSHASGADWHETSGHDVPVDPARRGTALFDGTERVSAAPTAAGGSLMDEIGAFRGGPDTLWQSFAGWSGPGRLRGDPEYLYAAFSELAAAMDPANEVEPFERDQPNRPVVWAPQPTAPTVYAEAEWLGTHAGTDLNTDDKTRLENMLALTYHWFFPFRDEGSAPPTGGKAEGQWEAATVFFEVTRSGRTSNGRPVLTWDPKQPMRASFRPHAVALARPPGTPPVCRAWTALARSADHPMLVAGKGSHRLMFEPVPSERTGFYSDYLRPPDARGAAPHTRLPGDDPGRDGPFGDWPTWTGLGLALALASPFVAVLVLLIHFLAKDVNERYAGDPNEPGPVAPRPHGDAGGGVARPAAGSPGPGSVIERGGTEDLWDAYRVDDPALSILRVVDRFGHTTPTPWWAAGEEGAAPPLTELPVWWDYPGRWGGVPASVSSWAPGTRRTDGAGRSLGYWNTVALTIAWAGDDPARPTRPQG